MPDQTIIDVKGARVPALGFGTWQITGRACVRAVRTALDLGYRHIDTAQMYKNEEAVGRGLKQSGLDREDIFLTTKVWTDQFADGDSKSAQRHRVDRQPHQVEDDRRHQD